MNEHRIVERVLPILVNMVAVATWTMIAAYVAFVGRFAASDTSCDGGSPQVDMRGGWTVIVTMSVWAAPFVIMAVRSRRAVWIASGVVASIIAAAVVVDMFMRPGEFCF